MNVDMKEVKVKTKERKRKKEVRVEDWLVVVGVVGFDLILMRKKNDNMRKGWSWEWGTEGK